MSADRSLTCTPQGEAKSLQHRSRTPVNNLSIGAGSSVITRVNSLEVDWVVYFVSSKQTRHLGRQREGGTDWCLHDSPRCLGLCFEIGCHVPQAGLAHLCGQG